MSRISKLKSALEHIDKTGCFDSQGFKGLEKSEKEIVTTLFEEGLVKESLAFLEKLDTDEEWETALKKIKSSKGRIVPFWKPLLKFAAIFIGLCMVGYLTYPWETPNGEEVVSGNVIKLKIGDNDVKVIEQGGNQQIVNASGTVLGSQNGNKIQYHANSEIDELTYNELEIPLGKIFDLELSDGTLVHLNSGTTIRYPVKFIKGLKREVFIDGEAYFKVAKDREHPFVVHAEEVDVEVLGTEFNLSSYVEDPEINTVLVEGSVRMTTSVTPEEEVVLVPGSKGAWNKTSHEINTEEVDIELYTGWVKGELVFRNAPFAAMEKKLERNYNVSIENNNSNLADKVLNARFHVRIESIEDVMKSIGELYAFEYEIDNRKIVIN